MRWHGGGGDTTIDCQAPALPPAPVQLAVMTNGVAFTSDRVTIKNCAPVLLQSLGPPSSPRRSSTNATVAGNRPRLGSDTDEST